MRDSALTMTPQEFAEKRNGSVNPEGATEAELKKRALADIYCQRPTRLNGANNRLEGAVLDVHALPHDLTDARIREHLLGLNLQQAGIQEKG